jgi:D-glycero-alpha-D-manno-heptose-7-phosphate kinase
MVRYDLLLALTVRARAPLRVSFGGGGSDVPPFVTEYGGAVLGATIDRYAYASVRWVPDVMRVESLDYGCQETSLADRDVVFGGQLNLAGHVMSQYREKLAAGDGIEAVLHNDAPPGSGLGSSSAITVALIAAISDYLRLAVDYYDIASEAWYVERCLARISGGFQDQYACTFGGFNLIEIAPGVGGDIVVNPLRVRPSTMCELEYRSVLAYVGGSHFSAHIIDKQASNIASANKQALGATHELRGIAYEMKNALLTDKISLFGRLLDRAWECKKLMADGITNERIDGFYEKARKAGALGGKVTGAGGGGFMYFICEEEKRFAVYEALGKAGAEPMKFAFTHEGVRSWRS